MKADRPKCYFDIKIGDQKPSRIVFELFYKELPKTCQNFLSLCEGFKKKDSEKLLTFKDSRFHRVITKFMAQGGDFTNFNGTGGESIYGEKFKDEGFMFKHTKRGMLSMANAGPNTNGSQFFLTFIPCDWLDGKHVVFGETIEGLPFLNEIEKVGSSSGKTSVPVTIVDCGVLG